MPDSNKLRKWLDETGTTQMELSELSGISQTQLTKYVTGRIVPGVRNAFAIQDATKGAVDARSWSQPRPAKATASKPKSKRVA